MAESGEQKETTAKNPPNFVTLVQLRERWLKKKAEEEEERIRKQQQEEREKEEEEERRRRKLEEAKELANSAAARRNCGTSSHWRENRCRRAPSNVVETTGFAVVVDDGDRDDEEEERRRKVEEAEEIANSGAARRNSGTSSHWRENRSRRTSSNVVETTGFAVVVDDGDRDDEEDERRRKLEEAKEFANSGAARRNSGTSSHWRGNRSRRTSSNVVETTGFAVVVDEGDEDNEEGERRWKLKEGKELENSNAVGQNSVTSSNWRQNRSRRKQGNVVATVGFVQVVGEGNEYDEAFKLKKGSCRRMKELREAKRAEKEKVMEEGKQPVVPGAVSKEIESMEVLMVSQREIDNVEKQISKRGAEIVNGSTPARKPKKKSKAKIVKVENGVSDSVEKETSRKGAEVGNGIVPARRPQRKSKLNMEFRGKTGNVEKVGSEAKIEEKFSELLIEEENGGGFETKNGVSDNVEKQISKRAEIGNESVPSRKPHRKSKVNMEFRIKIGKNAGKEDSRVEIEERLGELSIEEGNGGFETKNGISDGNGSAPSRKPHRKSKVNMEFRRRIDTNVEKEESIVETEGEFVEPLIEEENDGCEINNGVSDGKYSRGRGRLNHSGRQNVECNERRYEQFHGSRGRRNGGRYRGRYGSSRMESNGVVWVRKEDAGSGAMGTVKSSDALSNETSN